MRLAHKHNIQDVEPKLVHYSIQIIYITGNYTKFEAIKKQFSS